MNDYHPDADWEGLAYAVCFLAMGDAIALNHRRECRAYLAQWSKNVDTHDPSSDSYFEQRRSELLEWVKNGGGDLLDELGLLQYWERACNRYDRRADRIVTRERARLAARRLHSVATGEYYITGGRRGKRDPFFWQEKMIQYEKGGYRK